MRTEIKFILAVVICVVAIWSPYNTSSGGFIVTDTVRGWETLFVTFWFPALYWILYGRGS